MTRKNKSISFDLTDEFEKQLLLYAEKAEKGKFSKYIKRLIANDMEGRQTSSVNVMMNATTEKDEVDSTDGFL